MKRKLKTIRRHHEYGAIAVETAIVLPLLILFVALPSVLWSLYFRQYTAVQKSAHDAVIYLAVAPRLEMTTAGPDGNFVALTLAKRIITRELTGILPSRISVDPAFTCYYRIGSATKGNACTPQVFKVDTNTLFRFDVGINVPYVNPLTGMEVDNLYMSTVASARYVGN